MNTGLKQAVLTALLAVSAVSAVCWVGCGGDDDGNSANNSGNDNSSNNSNSGSYSYSLSCRDRPCEAAEMPDGKTWMTENINYQTSSGSCCYDNSPDSCAKYGRLYTWSAAKTACPTGWHLPTRDEWDQLAESVGGRKYDNYGEYHNWFDAGKKLKSTTGWYNNGNGTDEYGFSALPGGYRYPGGFYDAGKYGEWWTATGDDESHAYYRFMGYESDGVGENDYSKGNACYSVRCVKDGAPVR